MRMPIEQFIILAYANIDPDQKEQVRQLVETKVRAGIQNIERERVKDRLSSGLSGYGEQCCLTSYYSLDSICTLRGSLGRVSNAN